MAHNTVSAEVLVIGGGGMAGRAAIEASRQGARVTKAMHGEFDKSRTTAAKGKSERGR